MQGTHPSCPYTGPPIFHPDTEDLGILHARRLYRAARLEALKSLEFVFDAEGELVPLEPERD